MKGGTETSYERRNFRSWRIVLLLAVSGAVSFGQLVPDQGERGRAGFVEKIFACEEGRDLPAKREPSSYRVNAGQGFPWSWLFRRLSYFHRALRKVVEMAKEQERDIIPLLPAPERPKLPMSHTAAQKGEWRTETVWWERTIDALLALKALHR